MHASDWPNEPKSTARMTIFTSDLIYRGYSCQPPQHRTLSSVASGGLEGFHRGTQIGYRVLAYTVRFGHLDHPEGPTMTPLVKQQQKIYILQ